MGIDNDVLEGIPNYIHRGNFYNFSEGIDQRELYNSKQQVILNRLDYIDRNPSLINPHFLITQSNMIPQLGKKKTAYVVMPDPLLRLNIHDILFHSTVLEYEGLILIEKGYTLCFELYGDDTDYYGFIDVEYINDKPESFTLKYPKSEKSFKSHSLQKILDEVLKRMHRQKIFNLDELEKEFLSVAGQVEQ